MTVTVIAEIGVNHNGDMDLARRLIDGAAEAGAQYAKFQSFKAADLVTRTAPKAGYQLRTTSTAESQLEMLRGYELSEDQHHLLKRHCEDRGIAFLSSAFDPASLEFLLTELRLDVIKFGSGELLNAPLLYAAARSGARIILSSGMATLADIEQALMVCAVGYAPEAADIPTSKDFLSAWRNAEDRARITQRVSLLQCTTSYPAPPDTLNLAAMATLRDAFDLTIGFSDHSEGTAASVAAVALGAEIIEKHITLDRALPGPDHRASLEIADFARMVADIRVVEKAIGDGSKAPHPQELEIAAVARKSLVATRPISAGEAFGAHNFSVKRPGGGVSPMRYWDYLGQTAKRDYDADEFLD
jgi:N-acetylneuraminate synthase